MKKIIRLYQMLFSLPILCILLMAFTTTGPDTAKSETCSQWQKSNTTPIEMRWCQDEFGEVNYQFSNNYSFEVHFWYVINCKDGKVERGNTTLNTGELSGKADMMKSIPENWGITKKEKKDATGKWVYF